MKNHGAALFTVFCYLVVCNLEQTWNIHVAHVVKACEIKLTN